MSEIYTATPTHEQYTLSFGIFAPQVVVEFNGFPAVLQNLRRFNTVFNFGVDNDAERSLAVSPPIPFTNMSEGMYTLKIDTNFTSIPSGRFDVEFINLPAMDLVSDSNDSQTDPWGADLVYIERNIRGTSSSWVLQADTTYSLVFSLDWNATYSKDTLFVVGDDVPNALRDLTTNTLWNGRLGISLLNIASVNALITGISFSGPAIEFHTGKSGSHNSQGRAVHDMKMGMPAFATELQEDGFTEGIWTSTAAFDAKDPMEESPYEPPDTERDREDDYPL